MNDLPIDPKGDAGSKKPPLALIPYPAAQQIAKVMQLGAAKYGPWNWRSARVTRMTYAHAIMRHLGAWVDGEDLDPESGQSHMAHIASSACIVLDAEASGTLADDRPPAKAKPAPAVKVEVPAKLAPVCKVCGTAEVWSFIEGWECPKCEGYDNNPATGSTSDHHANS